ncbi:MAG: hypothetical protein ACSHYF_10510 [Verrucomicrobiaceae bacterium]
MSVLFMGRFFLGLMLIGSCTYGIFHPGSLSLAIISAVFLLNLLLLGIQLAESSACRCAVCTTPLFQSSRGRGGKISPRAKSLGGSRRLYRSMSILLGQHYHCNHCGEKVKCGLTRPTLQPIGRVQHCVTLPRAPGRRAS